MTSSPRPPAAAAAAAVLVAVLAAVLAGAGPAAGGRVRSNSQIRLPERHLLADVDGDGRDEWVVLDGRNTFAARVRVDMQGVAHRTAAEHPTTRAFAGLFSLGSGKDAVCALSGRQFERVECLQHTHRGAGGQGARRLAPLADRLPSALTGAEEIFAASFVAMDEGDGDLDLVLTYLPAAGVFKLWFFVGDDTQDGNAFMEVNPEVMSLKALNAAAASHRNAQVRVGNFGGDALDDLALVLPDGSVELWIADGTALRRAGPASGARVPKGAAVAVAHLEADAERDHLVTHLGASVVPHTFAAGGRLAAGAPLTGADLGLGARLAALDGRAHLYWLNARRGRTGRSGVALHDFSSPREPRWHVAWPTRNALGGGKPLLEHEFSQLVARMGDDPDGDGLVTRVELGAGPLARPPYAYGASPFAKDLFLAVAHMRDRESQLNCEVPKAALELARRELAFAGVNLHVDDLGPTLPWISRIGRRTGLDFGSQQIRQLLYKFPHTYKGVFRYVMSAHELCHGDECEYVGMADGLPGWAALLGICSWELDPKLPETVVAWASTLLHEVGHTLALTHSGLPDAESNQVHFERDIDKPNHSGVMTYTSTLTLDGKERLLFADWKCKDLDERALDETKGIECTSKRLDLSRVKVTSHNGDGAERRGSKAVHFNKPVDWNNDGRALGRSVRVDLNGDGVKMVLKGTRNEIDMMDFVGGGKNPIGRIRGLENDLPPWPEASAGAAPFGDWVRSAGRGRVAHVDGGEGARKPRVPDAKAALAAQHANAAEPHGRNVLMSIAHAARGAAVGLGEPHLVESVLPPTMVAATGGGAEYHKPRQAIPAPDPFVGLDDRVLQHATARSAVQKLSPGMMRMPGEKARHGYLNPAGRMT